MLIQLWFPCLCILGWDLPLRISAQFENANRFGVQAIYIFGDSTVDAGNNNVYQTIMHSNHYPYGREIGIATGRFSDGLLAPDFVAHRLNLPLPLAYTTGNVTGTNLLFGANFASAASGFIDSTANMFNVVSFTQQLKWFNQYRLKLTQLVGEEKSRNILSTALYIVSSGSNDYIYYRLNNRLSSRYNENQFTDLLISQASGFMKELYNAGARRFAVVSVPPIGCLPSEITTAGQQDRSCVPELNRKAEAHNVELQKLLEMSRRSLTGSKIAYLDCYTVLFDAIHNPSKYGFKEVSRGCCGSGYIEVGDLCNRLSIGTCEDASKYVFWDSFHPTQTMYKIIADVFYEQAAAQLI